VSGAPASGERTERRGVAVVFAELRNFTRLSEVLDPERTLELADEFFALVAREVQAQHGKVLAVHNDSVLNVFFAAADALRAAQAVQREFAPVGERWQTDYGFPAAVALGVHLGNAALGMAGPPGARQYVAFGDCVSVAERLVHRARAGEIVFSLDFFQAVGADPEELGAEALPPLELARRPAIPLYGLLLETRLDFT
jgi:adenylate cyclase